MKKTKRFRPVAWDTLEDRVVLSSDIPGLIALQQDVEQPIRTPENQNGDVPIVAPDNGNGEVGIISTPGEAGQTFAVIQVIDQINQRFVEFNQQYLAAQDRYYEALREAGPNGAPDALEQFRNETRGFLDTLALQVEDITDVVPGGAGFLPDFMRARLQTDAVGGLKHDLTSIPPVGEGISASGYGHLANQSIAESVVTTNYHAMLYDRAIREFVTAFFEGTLPAIPPDFDADIFGGTPVVQWVNDRVNERFVEFNQQFLQARQEYFNALQTGDPQAGEAALGQFRDRTVTLTENLSQQAIEIVETPAGGAGSLPMFLRARLSDDSFGSLRQTLTSIPPAGPGAELSIEDFTQLTDRAVSDAVFAANNFVGLYDLARFEAAAVLFSAFGRFRGLAPGGPVQAFGAGAGAGAIGAQSALTNSNPTASNPTGADVQAQQIPGVGGVLPGPGVAAPGFGAQFFRPAFGGGFPRGFDQFQGFGGLGTFTDPAFGFGPGRIVSPEFRIGLTGLDRLGLATRAIPGAALGNLGFGFQQARGFGGLGGLGGFAGLPGTTTPIFTPGFGFGPGGPIFGGTPAGPGIGGIGGLPQFGGADGLPIPGPGVTGPGLRV